MQTSVSPQKTILPQKISENVLKTIDRTGLIVAIFISSLWIASLVGSLTISIPDSSWVWLFFTVLARTYLHTGLFILAHDAMHGNLIPYNPRLNHLIGRFAVRAYAFLPYEHCRANHRDHHCHTSQSGDPDFHGEIAHPVFWYCKFIREYFPWRSLVTFLLNVSLISLGLIFLLHVSFSNLILFWLLPLVLSSLQLFFFGTYLPHRQVCENTNFSPRMQRDRYTTIWSFLSCYNFGHYHWEHHEYPETPWYELHDIHQRDF